MIVILRSSGKRTLSKLNADLVVTVALGSILATVLLSKDVALLEGVTDLCLLVLLQFVIAWLSVRYPAVGNLIKSEPALLAHKGAYLEQSLRSKRITKGEIEAALRGQGLSRIEDAESVVLESDGSISVVPSGDP